MSHLKRPASLAALIATLAALSCKESTNPAATDPTAMASAVTTLNSAFSQNAVFQSLAALSGNVTLAPLIRPVAPAPGSLTAPDAATRQLQLMRTLARSPAAVLVLFPANVLGHTFQWDTASHSYRITDSTLTGAPSNGVRFILYQVDSATSMPRIPLTTTGYVDLSDESNFGANAIRVVVRAASATAADYVVSEVITTSGFTLTATGYVQDVLINGPQITFDLSHALTMTGTDTTLVSDYTASGNGATVTMLTTISAATASESFDWTFSKNGTVEMTGSSDASGSTIQFKFNGALFATLDEPAGGTSSFTGPGGRALTTGEMLALAAIAQGFAEVFFHLTLVFAPALLFFA